MNLDSGFFIADLIMGSGKTSAAINYINNCEDENTRFIFLTPYESEFTRIVESCSPKSFVTPRRIGRGKLFDLGLMLKNKSNIASSHALFEKYDPEMLQSIRDGNYILFLDEAYDVVRPIASKDKKSFEVLLEKGEIEIDEFSHRVRWVRQQDYSGSGFSDVANMITSDRLVYHKGKTFVWVFPVEILRAFKSVIILTYMFDAQPLKLYLEINGISCKNIGIQKHGSKNFQFCDISESDNFEKGVPERIHILQNDKLNSVGEKKFSLSKSTTQRDLLFNSGRETERLGKNIRNVQKNIFKCSNKDFMWTSYDKEQREKIADKNIKMRYVVWNKRATNDYANCHYLAYGINLYSKPELSNYFTIYGFQLDIDRWTLSIMLQWIWRSAIRNGEDIWIYIPSKRMRNLLTNWLIQIGKGGDTND